MSSRGLVGLLERLLELGDIEAERGIRVPM
jgi:hypothetical protein